MSGAELQLAALARLHELFELEKIDYWVFGGWAVDFHAGAITRLHDDVDIAVWLEDLDRVDALLLADGWTRHADAAEEGFRAYERGSVRLGLAFPTCGNAAGWPDGSFGNDRAALNGVQARVVSLSSLRVDKSEHRDDPVVAAKDHADLETLAELS